MPDRRGLFAERHPILILVAVDAGVGRRAAIGDEDVGQLEVAPVAGHPIQVDQPDDLRRIEAEVGERRGRRREHPVQVVRQLHGDLQQAPLAGRFAVHGGRGEAVPDVVQLVVVDVLPAPPGRVQRDLGVEVAVRLLGGGDPADDLVHLPVQSRIPGYAVDVRHRLQPLVAVAVAPVGSPVFALFQAGRNPEIAQARRVVGVFERPPHARQDRAAAEGEAVRPESAGPAALPDRRPLHPAVRTGVVVLGPAHHHLIPAARVRRHGRKCARHARHARMTRSSQISRPASANSPLRSYQSTYCRTPSSRLMLHVKSGKSRLNDSIEKHVL